MSPELDTTNPRQFRNEARELAFLLRHIPDGGVIQDLALTLTETLALGDLDPDRVARLEAAHALATELAANLDLDRTGARERGLDRAQALVLDLARARDRASSPTGASTMPYRPASQPSDAPEARKQIEPAPAARRLLVIAVRLLPDAAQLRYEEEFGSELAELTRAGLGRSAQLTYSARQVLCAWQLRAELKAKRRRGAVG